ncbi:MAG TPA: DUF3566 domain-containing protein [Acidimicrobiales bacterium]|jgi:hypothetical protein|nr:DUF3566 domain-containing protein [Acidimicrobiales bacterium]
MASGPQPAVEGTSSGSGAPSPANLGSSDGVLPRSAPTRRPGEAAPRRSDPRARSAPANRPPSGAADPLPVGRARPSDRRGIRHHAGNAPRVVAGRRTRRVVRKIDIWTVLKLSFLFYLCVFLVFIVAGVVLWNIAQAFNVIASVEKFIRSIFDLQKFTFRPTVVLQSSVLGGAVLVLLGTGANVLASLLYNLISDVVGGVQFIVLEETTTPE